MEIGFTISSDKNKLNINAIHDYLCYQSYWAQGRTIEAVRKSIDNSLCFGVYDKDDHFVGFARVITDYIVFAYLLDLFILESHRGRGLGKSLVNHIVNDESLENVRWLLDTKDAHQLYQKFGFREPAFPEKLMERRKVAK